MASAKQEDHSLRGNAATTFEIVDLEMRYGLSPTLSKGVETLVSVLDHVFKKAKLCDQRNWCNSDPWSKCRAGRGLCSHMPWSAQSQNCGLGCLGRCRPPPDPVLVYRSHSPRNGKLLKMQPRPSHWLTALCDIFRRWRFSRTQPSAKTAVETGFHRSEGRRGGGQGLSDRPRARKEAVRSTSGLSEVENAILPLAGWYPPTLPFGQRSANSSV
jgi:hypothetical protein